VRLSDGVELLVESPVGQIQQAIQEALSQAKMLEINVEDGQFVVLNPNQVVYLKAVENGAPPQHSSAASRNGVHEAEPA
jgi:hypothetical protein